jgi:hypothetical protein
MLPVLSGKQFTAFRGTEVPSSSGSSSLRRIHILTTPKRIDCLAAPFNEHPYVAQILFHYGTMAIHNNEI